MRYTKQSEDKDIAQTFLEKLEEDIDWICQEALVKDKNHKDYKKKQAVRDHCHFTGK